MEEWHPIGDRFPKYSISTWGRVMNEKTGHIVAQSRNQQGFPKVSINDDTGRRSTVEVVRLVAHTFVPGYSAQNDTPIHLDGNKEHTFVENVAWRPRWFAARYHQQFKRQSPYHMTVPIIEIATERVFDNSLEAAQAFGVLERDILNSCSNHEATYPDGAAFRLLSDNAY